MNDYEFGKLSRPYNKVYFEMFGTVPSVRDYACTREQFLDALKHAVTEKNMIESYLPHIGRAKDPEAET